MADRDPAINLSADVDLVWKFLFNCFVGTCQVLAARSIMGPGDYERYTHLTRNLFSGATPYSEFRNQIRVLLQNYRHLTVYWVAYDRWKRTGTLQSVDYPLVLYPVNLCVQWNIIPHSVYERLLGYTALRNRASEWSRADMNLVCEFLLNCFIDWCQGQAARSIMGPRDYGRYTHLTWNLFNGVTPYSKFLPQMQVLLQNYRYLTVYWNVYHHSKCTGTVQLVDYLYPVSLCVRWYIIPDFFYERLLGDTALRIRASVWSREQVRPQARPQARQHHELQADDSELQADDGERKSEDSERTETDSDGDRL